MTETPGEFKERIGRVNYKISGFFRSHDCEHEWKESIHYPEGIIKVCKKCGINNPTPKTIRVFPSGGPCAAGEHKWRTVCKRCDLVKKEKDSEG